MKNKLHMLIFAFVVISSLYGYAFAEQESTAATTTAVMPIVPETESSTAVPQETAQQSSAMDRESTATTTAVVMPTVPETESSTAVPQETALRIDSETLYEGMDKTYKDGYVPTVQKGKVQIVLPLLGDTLMDEVVLSADLGTTTDSPFVYGNYSQNVKKEDGVYLFELEIPLDKNRINGVYPVVLTASYIDRAGSIKEQPFTVYVNITDGKSGETTTPAVNTGPEPVRRPELFISGCEILPQDIEAGETFNVKLTVENIGNLQAKNVKLTYSSESGMLWPTEQNNVQLLGNLSKEKSVETEFVMMAAADALAGIQSFEVTLNCGDAYGGDYVLTRSFSVQILQPAELSYDKPSFGKFVTAGDSITLPANVFNTGKSTLRNVQVSLEGNGLFPESSIFLGDILPGQAGYGQMNVFVGMMTDHEGKGYYGETVAQYIISYTDEVGKQHAQTQEMKTLIREPIPEPTPTPDPQQAEKDAAASQWWISALIVFAILAILISWIITTRVIRSFRIGKHSEI